MIEFLRLCQRDIHRLRILQLLTGGDLPKVLFYQSLNLFGIIITGDDKGGIVGYVELLVKLLHILDSGIGKIFHLSDDIPAVRMAFRIKILQQHVVSKSVRTVINSLPLFILHHILLQGKRLRCDSIAKETHAVRFEPHGHLNGILRHHLEIDGLVKAGEAVEHPSGTLNIFEELILLNMLGTLEHHVFKEMGKSGLAGHLPA